MIKLNQEYGGYDGTQEDIIIGSELYTEKSLNEEYNSTLYRISQIEEELEVKPDDTEKINLLTERREYLKGISEMLIKKYTERINKLELYIQSESENIDENPSITEVNIIFAKTQIEELKRKMLELQ